MKVEGTGKLLQDGSWEIKKSGMPTSEEKMKPATWEQIIEDAESHSDAINKLATVAARVSIVDTPEPEIKEIRVTTRSQSDHTPVNTKLKEIIQKTNELWQNPDSEIDTKYTFLQEKIKELCLFKPIYYNHHFINILDDDNIHFGKFPEYYLENLLYYYTKEFDVVFDPFAGGGTTIDCCKKWMRKYYCSDMNPIETRSDINKWNINNGLPKDIPSKIDFVFLDPPYWRQAENKYSKDKEDFGNMDINTFYKSIEKLVKELKKKMKSGYVAFVISPTQWKNENYKFEDHIIEVINIFVKNGFTEEMRYVFPYSTEQYNGTQVNIAKEKKFPLCTIRDLVVFKKI